MAYKQTIEIDMDQFADFLRSALESVKTEEDPKLLGELKKVYNKIVPWGMGRYVGAYLAKQAVTSGGKFRGGYKPRFDERRQAVQQERPPRTERPRIHIDESQAKTIFVGMGRNRHFFIKDMVGLLCSVGKIERERIGDIRILSNYSFVQLFAEDAEKAIARLNGYEYRHFPLSVSYAQQKADRAAENPVTDAATAIVEADAQAYSEQAEGAAS